MLVAWAGARPGRVDIDVKGLRRIAHVLVLPPEGRVATGPVSGLVVVVRVRYVGII